MTRVSAHSILWISIGFSTELEQQMAMCGQIRWSVMASVLFGQCVDLQQLSRQNFFFEALKVYNQDRYTSLVVVVNAGAILWTSRFTDVKSNVYARYNVVYW